MDFASSPPIKIPNKTETFPTDFITKAQKELMYSTVSYVHILYRNSPLPLPSFPHFFVLGNAELNVKKI